MRQLLVSFILGILLLSCTSVKNSTSIVNELTAIDSIQRKAHYEKDAVLLGSIMADSFYVAEKGKISWSNRSKMINGFSNYFKTVTYSYWENIKSPIIEIGGKDLAIVTYNKRTVSSTVNTTKQDTAVFAWASIIKKTNGKWEIKGIITTDDQK